MPKTLEEINDGPILYGDGSAFGATNFSISADDDRDHPRVNLHAHRSGIGGLFGMVPSVARQLAQQLIDAADTLEAAKPID